VGPDEGRLQAAVQLANPILVTRAAA